MQHVLKVLLMTAVTAPSQIGASVSESFKKSDYFTEIPATEHGQAPKNWPVQEQGLDPNEGNFKHEKVTIKKHEIKFIPIVPKENAAPQLTHSIVGLVVLSLAMMF